MHDTPEGSDIGSPATREEEGLRRVRRVFGFLRAFAERRSPTVRSLDQVGRKLRLGELPEHPAIRIGSVSLRGPAGSPGRGSAPDEEEGTATTEPLLRIRRPVLSKAPAPPDNVADWVLKGWEKPEGKVAVWNIRNRRGRAGKLVAERFADDPARTRALSAWSRTWNQWAEVERPAREAMKVFETLYALHGDIERQGERIELLLGEGRLHWNLPDGPIDHPILLQRVDLVFDPDVPEFRVVDSDRGPELYGPLLLAGGTLSGEKLDELTRELEAGGFHPLAGDETSAFLRRLVSLLGPSGALKLSREESGLSPAGDGPVIVRDVWLFARDRAVGFGAAFDRVLEDLQQLEQSPEGARALPAALTRIVGLEPGAADAPAAPPPASAPAGLAALPPGEHPPQDGLHGEDLLLSKPANAEQVQIVRALERHRAVLVQGPPGTGKSHTIANLVGHLVAQGKRVLVTSYTTKALRVLRDQVVEELRPLCVSVLDNDLEGRTQMEHAVRGIVHRLSTSTEERLAAEAEALAQERQRLHLEVDRLTAELRTAREGEYLPIKVGDEEVSPADAARHVEEQGHRLGFLPGPLPTGAGLPLGEGELRELYASNDEVSADHEQVLADRLPARADVMRAEEMRADVEAITASKRAESTRYWRRAPELEDAPALEAARRAVDQLLGAIAALTPWQRKLVAAGRTGGGEEQIWRQLAEQVRRASAAWQEARLLLIDHAPTIDPRLSRDELADLLPQIQAHVEQGGAVGGLSMLFRSRWRTVLDGCRVRGRAPASAAEFAALAALADVQRARAELAERWTRQAEAAGLPAFSALPDPPEPTLGDYVQQFERLLGFWAQRWGQVQGALAGLGFSWETFRADEIARSTPSAPFESDLSILGGPLKTAVEERLQAMGRLEALKRLKAQAERLGRFTPGVCRALQSSLSDLDVDGYERELRRLEDLWRKAEVLARRRELLRKLGGIAPEWAAAVDRRRGVHGALVPPRDLAAAWRWRQLEQELAHRAARDDRDLSRRLEGRLRQLREVTVDLVDRKAWLAQLRRTGLEARQALIGWADTQRKIGKGTGKRAPALQLKARELLTRAREAVPVWIMPLARVAESFDPRAGKFDVVIVDEASQCDLAGLLALYLGQGAVIVGDHEQVSPSAIGEAVDEINALISQFLGGVPNSHLYDGQTSVYDLARQSFGGTIGLREHFRCVPEIIEFSNQLSYHGEIRPLRDPNTARRPHTVEYAVPESLAPSRRGKMNDVEAQAVAALVAAAMQMPEFEGKTFGAISLLGDEQATLIQSLVQRLVPLPELDRRRFVSGNPAQFQGDERDIVFLSMVDVPEPHGQPLPMQERVTFKQRYNVAASRAKDMLWLVHSLDPRRDLQPGDLRRRLIEHVREPQAARKATTTGRKAQSPFEEEVVERLRGEGFRVDVQVDLGGHPVDMVVSDGRQQVAVECDGDRQRPAVRIAADMARQAVLERVGWRFIRVRSTRFFRDRDATMDAVFAELGRLGMQKVGPARPGLGGGAPEPREAGRDSPLFGEGLEGGERPLNDAGGGISGENLRNKIVRRAWQLMREQEWVGEGGRRGGSQVTARPEATRSIPTLVPAPTHLDADGDTDIGTTPRPELVATGPEFQPHPAAQAAELVLDDTTEPNFVILEQWEDRESERSSAGEGQDATSSPSTLTPMRK